MDPVMEKEGDKVESPLYKRMNIVMHGVIFMYAASFWIQTGVLPVRSVIYIAGMAVHQARQKSQK